MCITSIRKIATGRSDNNAAHVVVNKSFDWVYYNIITTLGLGYVTSRQPVHYNFIATEMQFKPLPYSAFYEYNTIRLIIHKKISVPKNS